MNESVKSASGNSGKMDNSVKSSFIGPFTIMFFLTVFIK